VPDMFLVIKGPNHVALSAPRMSSLLADVLSQGNHRLLR